MLRLAAFAILCFCLDLFSITLTRQGHPTASFWPVDGLLLAVLLSRRQAHERAWLAAAAFGANLAACRLVGHPWSAAVLFAGCNLTDVALAFLVLRNLGRAPELLQRRAVRPLLLASLLGPLLASLVIGLDTGSLRVTAIWFSSHALSIAIIAPITTDALRGRIVVAARRAVRRRAVGPTALFILSLVFVFGQSRYPLLFLVILPLLAVASRLGPTAATTAILPLAVAAVFSTCRDWGPFGLNPAVCYDERIIMVQIFVLASLVAFRAIGHVARERDRLDSEKDGERVRLAASEERYRLLADNATDVVSRIDPAGSTIYVSPACAHVFGLPPAALIGRRMLEIIHPDDRDGVATMLDRLASGQEDARIDYRVIRGDGEVIWIEASLRALRHSAAAALEGFVSIARDVTTRHDFEVERASRERALQFANFNLESLMRHLARARDQAEQANKAKSNFLANMSHELRTPLNGLLGHSEMLRLEGGLTPSQMTRVEAMLGAGGHLLRMINAVLDLSTIEADEMECRTQAVDLSGEILSCIDLMRAAAEAKSLTLRFEAGGLVRPRAIAHPMRLRQVLLNLMGNAVKYTAAGSVTMRLSAAAAGRIRISVADTGPGIDPAHRERLFNQFDRLDIESRTSIEGAGLGLSLSARLTRLMHGSIGHDDNETGGSVFWIELPGEAGGQAEARATPAAAPPVPPADGARSLRVLVVDDVAMNREIAAAFIRSGGHEAVAVDGGEAAVEILRAQRFDVVLMDARMPVMDGFETTRRIRSADHPARDVPVIALTALAFADQVRACGDAGMDGYLSKPIRRDLLLREIQSVVRPVARHPAIAGDGVEPPAARLPDDDHPALDRAEYERVASFLDADAVRSCLEQLLGRTSKLRPGLRDDPGASALVEEAHALAGSAGTFGFGHVAATARSFEQSARDRLVDAGEAQRRLDRALEAAEGELRRLVALA